MGAPVSEGDVILDKYRVERVLGQGGMGVVVAATHVDLDQRVALKFLLPNALEHQELVERFAREAKAAARIQSQHVVRVLDTGRMPTGAPFMVMEYLEGSDLAAVVEQGGPLDPGVAIDHVLQACEAIGEAHSAGIVHRDLKPSNLFLAKQRDRRTMVKVLDFGISKVEDPKSAPLTRTATMMGSAHYMSPEQLTSSKDVDARTDIWSLGVILYEIISGVRPFEAETMPEIVAQILQNRPKRLGELRGDVPRDLELVIARCLASSPQERFPSVADLATALCPFAADETSAATSVARIRRVLGKESFFSPTSNAHSTRVSPGALDAPLPKQPYSQAVISVERGPVGALAQAQTAHAVSIARPTNDAPRAQSSRRFVPLAVGGALLLGISGFVAFRSVSRTGDPSSGAATAQASAPTAEASASATETANTGTAAEPSSAPSAVADTTAAVASVNAEPSSSVPARATTPPRAAPSAPPARTAPKSVPTSRPEGTAKAAASPTTAPSPTGGSKSPLNMGIK